MMNLNIKGFAITFCLSCLLYGCALFEKEFILPLPVAENADQINAAGFTAHWQKVTGASGYLIDIASDKEFTQILSEYNNKKIETTSAIINGLQASTTYYYRIRANISSQISKNSNTIEVSTTALDVPIVYPATEAAATSFRVHWKAIPLANSYLLDVATDSDFKNLLTDYGSAEVVQDTSLLVTNVKTNTLFFYRVRIKQSESFSDYSNIQSVFTSVLPQPVALAASSIELTSFVANWEAMPEATSYRIDVATDALFQQMVTGHTDETVNTNHLTIANLDANTAYYYRIRAVNSEATSNHSELILVRTLNLDTPVTTQATDIQDDSFTANWNLVNNATSYLLDVALDQDFTQMVSGYVNLSQVNNVTIVQGLESGTTYFFRVRTLGLNATSEYSNITQVNTLPISAPVALAAISPTVLNFTANWQAPDGITTYLLDVATDVNFTSFLSGYQAKEITGTSQIVEGIDFKQTYYYRVSSKKLSKISAYSNTITVEACISGTCKVTQMDVYVNGSSTKSDYSQTFTYDAQNRLTLISRNKPSRQDFIISYNADNTFKSVMYAKTNDDTRYDYTYNNGQLEFIKKYDVSSGSDVFKEIWIFGYNSAGQRTSWVRYRDLAQTDIILSRAYTFDTQGNVNLITGGTTGRLQNLYTYDDKVSLYATFHQDLAFFVVNSRNDSDLGFMPTHNITFGQRSSTDYKYTHDYNSKNIAIQQNGYYTIKFTVSGCSF